MTDFEYFCPIIDLSDPVKADIVPRKNPPLTHSPSIILPIRY